MRPTSFDVAIVGAGPAGSATAFLLASAGLRVALLDRSEFPRNKTCGDGLTPRATGVLDSLGVLTEVERYAVRCPAITLRNSDQVTYRLELSPPTEPARDILVLPRVVLDEILREHAVAAGATFIAHARVEALRPGPDGRLRVLVERSQPLEAEVAVLAIGASTGLLRRAGLLARDPPVNLAARAYFEDVDGLDDTVVIFFDGVKRPGYGWVFPTGPRQANIGCGVFSGGVPQMEQLRSLLEAHPYLRRILKNATQVGPMEGHPLRTDFTPLHSGRGRIVVVGEALGLVNPLTGEGIDYALESAALAAKAILHVWRDGRPATDMHRGYQRELSRKFTRLFAFSHLAQRFYFRDGVLDRFLRRAQQRPYLRRILVDACFGGANPVSPFSAGSLWEALRP